MAGFGRMSTSTAHPAMTDKNVCPTKSRQSRLRCHESDRRAGDWRIAGVGRELAHVSIHFPESPDVSPGRKQTPSPQECIARMWCSNCGTGLPARAQEAQRSAVARVFLEPVPRDECSHTPHRSRNHLRSHSPRFLAWVENPCYGRRALRFLRMGWVAHATLKVIALPAAG